MTKPLQPSRDDHDTFHGGLLQDDFISLLLVQAYIHSPSDHSHFPSLAVFHILPSASQSIHVDKLYI